MQKVQDKRWTIPEGTPSSTCRGCGGEIFFVPYVRKADNKRGRMPCDADGTPHFATCPDAEKFRRRRS